MEKLYLIQFFKDEITELMNEKREQYHSITLSLTILKQNNVQLYNEIKINLKESLNKWNKALLQTQYDLIETGTVLLKENYSIKQICFVHFNKLPKEDNVLNDKFPSIVHHNNLIQISGKVVRRSKIYNYQKKRNYICSKCKEIKIIESTYEENYNFPINIIKCKNLSNNCRGILQPDLINFPIEYFIKYQECSIEEETCSDIKKSIPKSIRVSLENDLVDKCDPGEFVSICGLYELQWRPFIENKNIKSKFYLNAIGIIKDESKIFLQKNFKKNIICAKSQWNADIKKIGQLNARNSLINSVCPEICDTYVVKLSIALALSSCYRKSENEETTKRVHSHLLLIGDPGVGKSRFLETAAQLSLRSASTTGLGSTNAGLTAACVHENGSYHLAAGALVLADNGVCCIDEFNLLQENDRTSIHEALEQQEINIAKAGILAKLNTRCVVVAAANPKCLTSFQKNDLNSSNIGIAPPLLSRFDLVLIMKNERNLELDRNIARQKLNSIKNESCWTSERLKSHFLASNEIQPTFTEIAKHLVLQYFLFCRQDPERDRARTTIRLQDGLNRLAQAHARLMLRDVVLGFDVVIIIKVLEASYSFGRLSNNRITMANLDDIGPTENEIIEILNKLDLIVFKDELLKELYDLLPISKTLETLVENIKETREDITEKFIDFEAEFGFQKKCIQKSSDRHEKNIDSADPVISKKAISEYVDEFCLVNLINSFDSDDIPQVNNKINKKDKCMNVDFEDYIQSFNEDIRFMDFEIEKIQALKKSSTSNFLPKAGCSKDWLKSGIKATQTNKNIDLTDIDVDAKEVFNSSSVYSKDDNQILAKIKINENSSHIEELLIQMDNDDDELALNIEHIDEITESSGKEKYENKKQLFKSKNLENNKSDDGFLLKLNDSKCNSKTGSSSSKKRNFNIDDIENFELESFLRNENLSIKKFKVIDNLHENNKKKFISEAKIDERNELNKEMTILNEVVPSNSELKTLYCTQQAKEKYLRDKAKRRTEFLTNITENELNELLDLDSFTNVTKFKK